MRPVLGRKWEVLGHAGHDAQCRTTFKTQHAGAGLSVELLADFGDDGTPSNKVVLKTTCRQTLGSKTSVCFNLPSTVAPHAVRHRFRTMAQSVQAHRVGHDFLQVETPELTRRIAARRRAGRAQDPSLCEPKGYLEMTLRMSIPWKSRWNACRRSGVWRHASRVICDRHSCLERPILGA